MAISFSYCGSSIQILKIASVVIDETIQMHSHAKDGYELHFIAGGNGILNVQSESFNLSKGSLFVTGPNILHKQTPDEVYPMHELCLYLVIKNSNKAESLLQYFTSHSFWIGQGNTEIKKLFQRIIYENENPSQWNDSTISSLVIELIVEMVKLYTPQSSICLTDKKTDLNESRAWILDELFYNECINGSLEDFAKGLGVCPRQAQRIIADYYGSTFKKLRQEARLAKASILLEAGDLSIEQVAQQCGYASLTSFNKAFKQKYTVTPKKYQMQKKE
ncbi:MAG: AraC family transcriptional regulator [Oscillospiraceae bacterium]|nr:AraC family transcriptional regulator [Oscillospiraceae bacterium]